VSVLDPLLFFSYVNDISRNTEAAFGLFVEHCIIYRKIMNDSDIETL